MPRSLIVWEDFYFPLCHTSVAQFTVTYPQPYCSVLMMCVCLSFRVTLDTWMLNLPSDLKHTGSKDASWPVVISVLYSACSLTAQPGWMRGNRSQRPRPRAQDRGIKLWERESVCVCETLTIPPDGMLHTSISESPPHCSLADSWETWGSAVRQHVPAGLNVCETPLDK